MTVSTSPWAGVWIAEDVDQIARGVESGSWIDGTLGVIGGGLDGLALVSDPVGSLLQYGVAWLIEHVKPLSEALDWLAGDPAQIAAQVSIWRSTGSSLRADADQLTRSVRLDTSEWQGVAATAYRDHTSRRDRDLQMLARATDAMAAMTEFAGVLVGTVRLMVRDAVATVVSRLIVYAGEIVATAGLATPVILEQATTLCASWAARIARWLKALIESLRNLGRASGRLVELLRGEPRTAELRREGDGVVRNGAKILMTRSNVDAIAAKYGVDLNGVNVVIDKGRRGEGPGREIYGITTPDGRITLTRDAFLNEEQLARTLAHERFHLDEIRSGMTVPRNKRKLAQWEARADAYEEQWWQEHRHLEGRSR